MEKLTFLERTHNGILDMQSFWAGGLFAGVPLSILFWNYVIFLPIWTLICGFCLSYCLWYNNVKS